MIHEVNELVVQLSIIAGEGTLLPLVVAVVNRQHWSPKLKQAVMIVLAIVVGLVTYLAQQDWSTFDLSHAGLLVLGLIAATQTAYHGLWKQSGITAAIEARTSPDHQGA